MEDQLDFNEPDLAASAIVREERADADVIHVFGEFAFGASADVENALVTSVRIGRRTICNLLGCTYLDAAGVNVLLRARAALGARLVVVAPESGIVRRVLDLVGITTGVDEAA